MDNVAPETSAADLSARRANGAVIQRVKITGREVRAIMMESFPVYITTEIKKYHKTGVAEVRIQTLAKSMIPRVIQDNVAADGDTVEAQETHQAIIVKLKWAKTNMPVDLV